MIAVYTYLVYVQNPYIPYSYCFIMLYNTQRNFYLNHVT